MAEETLNSRLMGMFSDMFDDILDELDFEYLLEYGTALVKPVLTQVLYDYLERYKTIVGEEVLSIFDTTDTKVEKQLIIQENMQLIDYISNGNNIMMPTYNNNNTLFQSSKSDTNNIHVANKKTDFIGSMTGLLNRLTKFFNIQVPSETPTRLESLVEDITRGVTNRINTPDTLFKIIPNNDVLNYLENRVFVASEKTLQRVTDNIYKIIGKATEQEGLHPYETAKILKSEFTELAEYESRRIARTEVLRSKHEAKWQRFQNNETVEYIQWIATVDEASRDDHAEQADMITYMGNTFPNGQRYPYDETGDPGDYINCRCDYESYYPDVGLSPPEGADYWFEEDMVPNGFGTELLFDVIFKE